MRRARDGAFPRGRPGAPGRNARGISLVEILVAAALLLLLLGVVFSVLVPGLRTWVRSEHHSQAQQSALLVATRASKDFQYANPESVHVMTRTAAVDGGDVRRDALIFLSSLDKEGNMAFDEGGDPLWQRRIVIYHAGSSNEVRSQEMDLEAPTSEPDPLVVTDYTVGPRDRLVARGVRSLSFDLSSPPLLKIRVETRSEKYASVLDTTSLPVFSSGIPQASPSPSASP